MNNWMCECLNYPVRLYDCNDCCWLNMTEAEQEARGIYHIYHRCTYYDKKVIHKTSSLRHDSYIHPCDNCRENNYVKFDMRGNCEANSVLLGIIEGGTYACT